MTKNERGNNYTSYMLRLWAVEEAGSEQRVMLRSVRTGESYYFPDLASLFAFLELSLADQFIPHELGEEQDGGLGSAD